MNVQISTPTAANPASYYLPMFAPDEPGDGGDFVLSGNQYFMNSYIHDDPGGSCGSVSDHTTREKRACKYANPKGATTTRVDPALPPRGPNLACNSRPLTRLTSTKNTLLTEIAALTADGLTNIHEGFMWAWRTISPNSVFADSLANPPNNLTRIIVLMTDGDNTWSPLAALGASNTTNYSTYSAYGYYRNSADLSNANSRLPPAHANPNTDDKGTAAMNALTREACTNARNAGVIVYTIALSVPGQALKPESLQLLADCAASPSRTFVANSSQALIDAFDEVARDIGDLRLSQ